MANYDWPWVTFQPPKSPPLPVVHKQEPVMSTPAPTTSVSTGPSTGRLPFAKISEAAAGLEKFAAAAESPMLQGLLKAFLPAQIQPLLANIGEVSERILWIRLFAALEQAAEGNSGPAARTAMAKVARDWADSIQPAPTSFVDGDIPGIRS